MFNPSAPRGVCFLFNNWWAFLNWCFILPRSLFWFGSEQRQKNKRKLDIFAHFYMFWLLFAPHCSLSRCRNRFHHSEVSWNIINLKVLFDWSELSCDKKFNEIPTCKQRQRRRWQRITQHFCERLSLIEVGSCSRRGRTATRVHVKLDRDRLFKKGHGLLVWSSFGAHPSAIAKFSPAQTSRTKEGIKL